jgi:hypothetical protein
MKRKIRYPTGTRVIDRESKIGGRVIHVFADSVLSDLRVVHFDGGDVPVTVPISTIRIAPIDRVAHDEPPPTSRRRRR